MTMTAKTPIVRDLIELSSCDGGDDDNKNVGTVVVVIVVIVIVVWSKPLSMKWVAG